MIIILLALLNNKTKQAAVEQGINYNESDNISETIKKGKAVRMYDGLNHVVEEVKDYYFVYDRYPNSFSVLDDWQEWEKKVGEPMTEINGRVVSRWTNMYDSYDYSLTKDGFRICFEMEEAYKLFKEGTNCINQNYSPTD